MICETEESVYRAIEDYICDSICYDSELRDDLIRKFVKFYSNADELEDELNHHMQVFVEGYLVNHLPWEMITKIPRDDIKTFSDLQAYYSSVLRHDKDMKDGYYDAIEQYIMDTAGGLLDNDPERLAYEIMMYEYFDADPLGHVFNTKEILDEIVQNGDMSENACVDIFQRDYESKLPLVDAIMLETIGKII